MANATDFQKISSQIRMTLDEMSGGENKGSQSIPLENWACSRSGL